jgi:hypothetical protein
MAGELKDQMVALADEPTVSGTGDNVRLWKRLMGRLRTGKVRALS